MKRKINFLVYPLAVIFFINFLVIVGCSDNKDEVLPDDDKPGKVYDIDGNEYKTVKIGDQIWMAENLRVTRYNNEDDIPTGFSNAEWENTTEGAYAIFDHNHQHAGGIDSPEEMVAAYGKLYNWYAVDDIRGLCPEGWSVPSDNDWGQLVSYIMDKYDYHNHWENHDINGVGNALRSCRQIGSPLEGDCDTSEQPRWLSGSHYGFDTFSFSALPGGRRETDGSFDHIGVVSSWWSTKEFSSASAWYRFIERYYGSMGRSQLNKTYGFSLRCVRD